MHHNQPLQGVYRSLAFVSIALILLVAVAGCQDRRATREAQKGQITQEAQNATPQVTATQRAPSSQQEAGTAVNRIVYLGPDGTVYTINPDGTDARRLTSTDVRASAGGHVLAQGIDIQVSYAWPTWSPDGTKLATTRMSLEGLLEFYSLEVIDASTGRATNIYNNDPGTAPVAYGAPHFTLWSPDSKHLAFLASTQNAIDLRISDAEAEGKSQAVTGGRPPIYFTWSQDSHSLLVHRRSELLWGTVDDVYPKQLGSLEVVALGFRAPSLNADGSKMAYVVPGDDVGTLNLANTSPPLSGAKPVLDIEVYTAFIWSPQRDEIAVAGDFDVETNAFGSITIISGNGVSRKTIVQEPLIGFFWSPDGEKIAYITFDTERSSFTWKYVDTTGGTPVELVEFWPSGLFISLATYFDQFAYSTSVWSPDSSRIVFSGTLSLQEALRRDEDAGGEDKVYVLDVEEGSIPLEIATSRFAAWSWN